MNRDYSYGIIPLKKVDDEWKIFLIRHRSGHWAFPKGHPEALETPIETAQRELQEETGLQVTFLWELEPFTENYTFYHHEKKILKTVTYFIATVEGKVKLQEREVIEYRWISLQEAEKVITFPEARSICRKVSEKLSTI